MSTNSDAPIEIETGVNPKFSVIWLHGLGADGRDFLSVVPVFRESGLASLRFVFPHAPVRSITVNGGMKMRGWYDIRGVDFARDEDADGLAESAAIVRGLIAREVARGVAAERIFLAGFSQGGAVVLYAGLRFESRLAGIIALSTYLPLADSLHAEQSDANRDMPIFYAHGRDDPLIPISLAQQSQRQLAREGYAVTTREYGIAHGVSAEEIDDVAEFLRARMTVAETFDSGISC